jgi:hypothetical protein
MPLYLFGIMGFAALTLTPHRAAFFPIVVRDDSKSLIVRLKTTMCIYENNY